MTVTSQPKGQSDLESADALSVAASAWAGGSSLETLSRPFLELLHQLTDLESVYLTEVSVNNDAQTILFADNRADLVADEGRTLSWSNSVCCRALDVGLRFTSDVDRDLPGSEVARQMGLRTYVSVPVLGDDDQLMGTLCGASRKSVTVAARVVEIMALLARLISDQWQRDRMHADERRRAAAAEKRLQDRDMFLAIAEHKLKSPLMVLQGWSDILAEDWKAVPGDVRDEALQDMRDAARDAVSQLNDLLAQARSGVLSAKLHQVPVPLSPLVIKTARQLQAAAPDHQIAAHVEVDAVVLGDQQALWQVLWHLGENAVKYSPDGGCVSLDIKASGEAAVVVSVVDEGLGVPTGVDVFAPFARGEHHPGINGTGLGLHIVQTLVVAMGGTVSAQRREERGSVLSLILPLARPLPGQPLLGG